MRKLFSIFSLVLLYVTMAFGQAAVDIPITLSTNISGETMTLNFGLDPTATDGIDVALGEAELPPWGQAFETRLVLPPFNASAFTSTKDYRNAPGFPFTGSKIHRLRYQLGDGGGTVVNINWNFPTGVAGQLQDIITGTLIDVPMTGSGSYQVADPEAYAQLKMTITYTNYGSVPAPVFAISPPSPFDFGTVNAGSHPTQVLTVTNTGNAPLNITGLTSSNGLFTFSPSFPPDILIAPLGSSDFTVTFSPTDNGPQSSTLTFSHNGPGPTTVYTVQGTGHVPAPVFGVTGGPLNFGPIELNTTSAPQPLTVNNTGDADLTVTLTSGDPVQFIVSPTTLVTIPGGGSAVFNVSFHPLATGPQSTNVTFTHNAGAPVDVFVQGSGFTTAPFFSIDPTSLNFGQVSVPGSATLPVVVTNTGNAQLEISGVVSSDLLQFSFAPNVFPVYIAAGASVTFNVTFNATVAGIVNGNLTFTHNAAGTTFVLPLQGEGRTQGGELKFIQQTRVLYDGSTNNQDAIVLHGYTGQPLKALQFDLILGKANEKLILNSVSRGDGIPAGNFTFDYQVFPGPIQPDGSHRDRIKVVILGNTNNVIMPGGPDVEILKFSYDVVDIVGNSTTTSNGLENVFGATATPVVDAHITAGPDELITIYNGTIWGLLGDVNLDNQVDLLDILVMIDHILGRITLTGQAFTNGDIAPWLAPAPLPTPDGVINVLDLAVLQNIVLTGLYPNGNPVNKVAGIPFVISDLEKITPGMDAKLTFFLSKNGITVGLESVVKVKGVQIELNGVNSTIPTNTPISSVFDQKTYYQLNDFIRTLTYDGQSLPIDAGQYLLAKIPFSITSPKDIEISKIIVADENNNALQKVEVEIKYDEVPIPLDYSLSQNFPNPFNPTTSVEFSVPKEGLVTIKLYDMLGQEIAALYSGNTQAGTYTLNWDGKDYSGNVVSSGSYIYRMTAGDFVQSKKMTYLK